MFAMLFGRLKFEQHCLRGSCVNLKDLPYNSTHGATLLEDPYCTNHTQPPLPPTPPESDGTGESFGLLASVTIICAGVVVVVFIFLGYTAYESVQLASWFDAKRDSSLEPTQEDLLASDLLVSAPLCERKPSDSLDTSPYPGPANLDGQRPLLPTANVKDDSDSAKVSVGLTFDSISYQVGSRVIIQSVSGYVKPGTMVTGSHL